MRPPSASAASRATPTRQARPISLLIVDDSIVVRTIMERMLGAHAAFTIAGTAANVEQAAQLLAHTVVDIILLDVEMPGTDGLTAIPDLLERGAGARIVMVSALCGAGAAASVKAMTLGAADTLLKPTAGAFGTRFEEQLIERLLRVGAAHPREAARLGEPRPSPERITLRQPITGPLDCIAIGSSTGGLHALSAFFAALPDTVSAPIIVTQHLPPSFMPYFAAQLADLAHRRCAIATDRGSLERGAILVAPGDAHLCVARAGRELVVHLDAAPVANGNMPSVDPMFESLAAAAGPAGLGVVLSGMGRDGAAGAARMVVAGGEIIVQDAVSSVVWGMPGAVARAGLATLVAAPAVLAGRVAVRSGRRVTA